MKQFAEEVLQCESYQQEEKCLSESLKILASHYPYVYSRLFREIQKREREANDPNKIIEWLDISKSKAYAKVHESLMLVDINGLWATKEVYFDNINRLLSYTIRKRSHFEESLKICCLIENSWTLAIIHEPLKHLIHQVKLLYNNKLRYCSTETMTDKFHSNRIQTYRFELLDVPCAQKVLTQKQQNDMYLWKITQHKYLNPIENLPGYDLVCFGNDHLDMVIDGHRRNSSGNTHQTIISQDMAFDNFLNYTNLQKYQWFFSSLSYLEITLIDKKNIQKYLSKVDRSSKNENVLKNVDVDKICLIAEAMRHRPIKLKNLLIALDSEVTLPDTYDFMTYMEDILHYPIPNKHCVVGHQLQDDIYNVMEKCLIVLLKKIDETEFIQALSFLGKSIKKYMECVILITGNQTFMRYHVEMMSVNGDILKDKVRKMHRDFD